MSTINAVNMCNIPIHNKVQSFQRISRLSQLLVFCKIMLQALPQNKNKTLLMMLIYKQRSPKIIMKGSKFRSLNWRRIYIHILNFVDDYSKRWA